MISAHPGTDRCMGDAQEVFGRILEKIFEYTVKCPVCNSDIKVSDYKYSIPYYGDILISSGVCENCGYVYKSVEQIGGSEPRRVIFKVRSPSDVNVLVIKSKYARIEIPELELAVKPGVYSQGYIITIEGLIVNFIEVLNSICRENEVDISKCSELLQKLEKARSGELEFTIIIYDYTGISDIVSDKAIREKLDVESV